MNTNKKKSINEKEEKFSQEYLAFCSVGTGHIFKLFSDLFDKWFKRFTFQFQNGGLYMENTDNSKTVTVVLHIEKKSFKDYIKNGGDNLEISIESKSFKKVMSILRKKDSYLALYVPNENDLCVQYYNKTFTIKTMRLELNEIVVDNNYADSDYFSVDSKIFQDVIKSVEGIKGKTLKFISKNKTISIYSANEDELSVNEPIKHNFGGEKNNFELEYKTDVFKNLLKLIGCTNQIGINLNPKYPLQLIITTGVIEGKFYVYIKDNNSLKSDEEYQKDTFDDVEIRDE